MGNRSHRRFRKFYQSQVTQILELLDNFYKDGQISLDTYLDICEQKGILPDENEMPPTTSDFPYEVQVAFFIHDLLSDRWEGMSGYYMGKDFSNLETLLRIWEVEDKKTCIYFIKHIEHRNAQKVNKEMERKRKAAENKAKNSSSGTNVRKVNG